MCRQVTFKMFFFLGGGGGGVGKFSTKRCGNHTLSKGIGFLLTVLPINDYQGVTCLLTKYETPFIPGVNTVE